jgi:predicted DNA binding CopG/RHH family protein
MSQKTKIKFHDDEEKALYEAIENEDYVPGKSALTPERKAELQTIAQNTINEKRTKISLRVPNSDLSKIKARAIREGIPYQSLINSILHKEAQS